MRITGHLLNATTPGKNDVFEGYVVEARYLVIADRAEEVTFREVTDQFRCEGTDNEFAFELPDVHQLALEKELAVAVRNRSGVEVFSKAFPLASVIRAERPLDLPIEKIEAAPVKTAVTLHGRLVWKDDPQKTDGFEGFKVTASYKAQAEGDEQTYVAQSATATLVAGGNTFSAALPAEEELKKDELVQVTVTYPDGHTASGDSFKVERLREDVVLEVIPPQAMVVKSDARAEEAKPERIKGKVVDLEGKHQIKNKQVILWGKNAGGARPLLVTITDGYGNFSGDRPKDEVEAALGTVAGTLNATVEMGVPVELEGVTEEDPALGKLPKFVYLVVKLPQPYTEDEEACACDGSTVPRQPDPEDLVKNSGAYSQDIGLNCVNFTTPNRTLEEFSYTMVVRTTDPAIKGTTLSDVEKRAERERSIFELGAGVPVSELPSVSRTLSSTRMMTLTGTARLRQPVSSLNIAAAASKFALPTYWKDLFKTVPGRGELNANNSIDWDSTPTFYQAATIAHGHVLHFKQIWKADGYSLGDLVYSLPLAPGQKKQVVIFDWDRTEYGRRDEDTHEDEALNSYLSHNRDILDITQGSLAEHMTGGSRASTSGVSGGLGLGIGAMFNSVMVGISGGFSASSGSGSSSAWQDSSRNVAATGMNQLRDMVQQGASAVRNQRSTVVQTARQTERFKVETEVVANHNHCHAITLQYFEVLRHYAIEQKLTHVQECLFIPLLMSEFDEAKVVRWKDQLRPALRDPNPRNVFMLSTGGISYRNKPLADGFDAIERRQNNYAGTDFPATTYAAEEVLDLSGDLYISLTLNRPKDKDDASADYPLEDAAWAFYSFFTGWTPAFIFNNYFAKRVQQERDRIFEETIAPKIAEGFIDTLKFLAIDNDGNPHSLDLDTTLISRYQREATLYVSIRPKQGKLGVTREQISKLVIYTNYDISASANSRIIVRRGTFRYRTAHFDGVLYRNDAINNDLKSTSISFPGGTITIPSDNVTIYTPLSTEELRNPKKEDEELSKKLRTHLNSNIEYYHKAIWYRMDPDRRYMLLDGFIAPNSNGKSVASVVENRVIGVAGNCLIMPVAPGYKLDPTYEYEPELDDNGEPRRDDRGNIIYKPTNLLDHYQPLTPIPPFRVSVPTRGVFGESIMGACNSCEKKDETRFWRWEESPNPDEPTPINPVQTTPPQRTEPQGLQPTAFPAPMINLQNAPPAPEPGMTLAGALGLLGKSDLFPNITGLDQNQKNALQAMLSNQESAKHYADKAAELAKQAANLKSGDSTVESIKKSMDDGTLDKDTGKKLIEDAYRAKISGTTSADPTANTSDNSELSKAAAKAVKRGGNVKVSQTFPDGTETNVEQNLPTEGKGTGSGSAASTTVPVFPTPYANSPQQDATLQQAFDDAVNGLSASNKAIVSKVGITIVQLGGAATLASAGKDQDKEQYSASLLKVAAMYAACELWNKMKAIATQVKPATDNDLYAAAKSEIDKEVKAAAPATITNASGMEEKHILPTYDRMFELSGGKVAFKQRYSKNLKGMISDGHNTDAELCIHGVGYGYMNAALAKGGFFDGSSKGIWLVGDFSGGPNAPRQIPSEENWPYARIDSENDGLVAQATTTFHMAKLLALMFEGKLVDQESSTLMLGLMAAGGSWFDGLPGTYAQVWARNNPIRITHAKVGRGPLKGAGEVFSEGAIVHEDAHSKDFAVVWQNLKGPATLAKMKAVAKVVEDTIRKIVGP